ncbi:MAG: hypothetical protein KF726_25005 [Anaerolineae bacterium]|nr:hypothetical protein [Anaerolineae bacterium]
MSAEGNDYDYSTREGILPISWNDFHGICKALALAAAAFNPQIILAVGRGGFYPGTLISHLLRADIYPVRLSRRVNDVVTYKSPRWLLKPPELVKAQRVLIVDEICDTGETLNVVKATTERLGAAEVRLAVMYAHGRGRELPDYVGLVSDALILNPWDREILRDGQFVPHPEYADAMISQGLTMDASHLIPATAWELAKG